MAVARTTLNIKACFPRLRISSNDQKTDAEGDNQAPFLAWWSQMILAYDHSTCVAYESVTFQNVFMQESILRSISQSLSSPEIPTLSHRCSKDPRKNCFLTCSHASQANWSCFIPFLIAVGLGKISRQGSVGVMVYMKVRNIVGNANKRRTTLGFQHILHAFQIMKHSFP